MQLKTANSILPLFPDKGYYLCIVLVLPTPPLHTPTLTLNYFVQFYAAAAEGDLLSTCRQQVWELPLGYPQNKEQTFLLSASSEVKILGKTCFQLTLRWRGFEATTPQGADKHPLRS